MMDDSELLLNQKVSTALNTIIASELKDNHDDTLIEKFCSLLNEFDEKFLENLVTTNENLLSLIDSHLEWKSFICDDDFELKIDNVVIVLRICKPLLNRELIFQIYLKQSNQNLIELVLKIIATNYKDKLSQHHMLNIALFSLFNSICHHQTGKQFLITHFLTPENGSFFIENLFDYDCQTRFIQKEIHLLLANIIGLSLEFDQTRLQEIVAYKFANLKFNLPKIVCNIIDLLPDRNEFFHRFQIFLSFEVFLVNCDRFDDDLLKQSIKLIELISSLKNYTNKTEYLIALLKEKLLKQQDCFAYSTFLISLSNSHSKCVDIEMYRGKSHSFIGHYLMHLLGHHDSNGLANLSDEERVLLENIPMTRLQTICLQQLNKLQPSTECHQLVPLLENVINVNNNNIANNKKHLNLLLSFFERLVIQNYDADRRIQDIYLQIYCNYPVVRKSILQSIVDIFRKRKKFDFPKFLPIWLNHLINVDKDDDDEIVDIIIELIFHIILEDEQTQELNEFLSGEHAYLLRTIDLEANCRANILSTLFMAHYCFDSSNHSSNHSSIVLNTNFLGDTFFEQSFLQFDQLDLEFRQQFFANMKQILSKFSIDLPQQKLVLRLVCQIFSDENDTELLLVLLNLIELIICKQELRDSPQFSQLIIDTNLFASLFGLFGENSFISCQVEMEIMQFLGRYRNDLVIIMDKYPDSKHDGIYPLLTSSSRFEEQMNKIHVNQSLNSPQLSLLDDIIHTSKLLSDQIVMDCY